MTLYFILPCAHQHTWVFKFNFITDSNCNKVWTTSRRVKFTVNRRDEVLKNERICSIETVTTTLLGHWARSFASLNKFDMRVDRTSLDNHGSSYQNSAISKLLITRWICHSQNFQDFITVLYQSSPSAGKLWWNYISFVDVTFFTKPLD